MYRATTSSRAFAEAGDGDAGAGADLGSDGADSTLALRSCETWWPDWMSGSGTLPVSSVCDTVVMAARNGMCRFAVCDWFSERRIVRANRAMVTGAVAGCCSDHSSRNREVWRSCRGLRTLTELARRNLGGEWVGLDIFLRPSSLRQSPQAQECLHPINPHSNRAGAHPSTPCLRTSIVCPSEPRARHTGVRTLRNEFGRLISRSGALDQAAWKEAGSRRARSEAYCQRGS